MDGLAVRRPASLEARGLPGVRARAFPLPADGRELSRILQACGKRGADPSPGARGSRLELESALPARQELGPARRNSMIARYTRKEMGRIWDERTRYQLWLKVELAVCEELARRRKIPNRDWRELKRSVGSLLKSGGVDPKRVAHHEAVTRHDV